MRMTDTSEKGWFGRSAAELTCAIGSKREVATLLDAVDVLIIQPQTLWLAKVVIAARALLRSPRGAAIIEFALILPFLVLLLVGLCDLGFAAYDSMQVQAAAEAGAQYAARHPWDATAVAAAVTGATGTSGVLATPAPSRVCGCPDGGTLTRVGDWVVDHCSPTVTCTSGSPPGVYALVSAQLILSPMLPYPGLPAALTLTGQTYRRLN
jgi:Flp pilus assembly protein TadG